MTKFLAEETRYSIADLVDVICQQLEQPYPRSDNLRTAAMYCPEIISLSIPISKHFLNFFPTNSTQRFRGPTELKPQDKLPG